MTFSGQPDLLVSISANRPPDNDPITVGGMLLCVPDARHPATILDVGPVSTVGSPLALLGARLHTTNAGGQLVESIWGYDPESWPGPSEDVNGAMVDVECVDDSTPPGFDQVELRVGLRATNAEAGGWDGIAVAYEYQDRRYVLDLGRQVAICAIGDVEGCPEIFEGE